jgi:hypothetical protein
MLLRLNTKFKGIEVDYESEEGIDKFYVWGVEADDTKSIILCMTTDEASALCSTLSFALQDKGIMKSEAQNVQR